MLPSPSKSRGFLPPAYDTQRPDSQRAAVHIILIFESIISNTSGLINLFWKRDEILS